MLDKAKPYPLYFVQKASPGKGDAFDFAYIYKFYTERTKKYQRLKYIMRIESYDDVFAVKFYAARDRKLETKYNRILRAHTYFGALRVFYTCASVIGILHSEFPLHSFVVNGAESNDIECDKVEDKRSTQRFRIYRVMALQLIGRVTFEHFQYKDISTYMLVNRNSCDSVEEKAESIKQMFVSRGYEP